MTLTYRPYSTAQDKHLMAALASQSSAHNLHVIDLPYRFCSWAFDHQDNIRLWFDDRQRLLAWAAFQTPFWSIDYACHADYEALLHREILPWADQHARSVIATPYGHPAWFINVFSGQLERTQDLEEAGFKCLSDAGEDSWRKVLLRRSSPIPVEIHAPPPGFTARPLAGINEVQSYVELHQSVFGTKNMTVEWRARTLQHPAYRPELDIVVEDPQGRLAAFCICWFDESSLSGQVEPLGSHEDFQGLGLGRLALTTGLRRLQALGAQHIYVETDSYRNPALRLYASLGFEAFQDVLVYRKDYPPL